MRKRFILLSLLLQLSFAAPELRHTQGFQGAEGLAGLTAMGPLLRVAYAQYLSRCVTKQE